MKRVAEFSRMIGRCSGAGRFSMRLMKELELESAVMDTPQVISSAAVAGVRG